ncbi:MAG: TMEM175 family protein [Chitinophagales bacterium]
MNKARLEAFSDGVMAIIITIMVLEIKVPHQPTLSALKPLIPVFLSYVLSFMYVAIYWGNHHHLFHTLHRVNGRVIWANLLLLFGLSLIPFSTGFMAENHFAQLPVAIYAGNLLLCAITYYIMQQVIQQQHQQPTPLSVALGRQEKKGLISLAGYVVAMVAAFWLPLISGIIFLSVAIWWIIPDKNIEAALDTMH